MTDQSTDGYEYRSVFDGYRESTEFHDWTTRELAEDEAEAFRALGCKNVRVERRRKHHGDANAGEFMAWAANQSTGG